MRTRVRVSLLHLSVEVILHEIPELQLLLGLEGRLLRGSHRSTGRPLLEFCRPIEVAVVAEGGVGHEPLHVLLKEGLVFSGKNQFVLNDGSTEHGTIYYAYNQEDLEGTPLDQYKVNNLKTQWMDLF